MPASIGVNLRVTGHCSQGGRKYMEDLFSVAYQQTEDERDLEYAFFGIYDGHGGREAAAFAKEHLMDSIVKQRQFWSDDDSDVLKAIRNGYMLTHLNMWRELDKWPKTVTGLPSTAGTTASIAFIRRGKIYIGHVGDSAIVLGYQNEGSDEWEARPLTLDHKPESDVEMERIQRSGGKVISKAGVPRVVWNRPRQGHKGPICKNTPVDEIPFLAVARSLGDLWSYNVHNDEFIVSPDPDVGVLAIDPSKFRCLIFGTDGLWNMVTPKAAVDLVRATEKHNEEAVVGNTAEQGQPRDWLNPSKSLVDSALERWASTRMRADNTSVVTLMLDPPGPPRATVLRARSAARSTSNAAPPAPARVPQNGLTIVTRYSDGEKPAPLVPNQPSPTSAERLPPCSTLDNRFAQQSINLEDSIANYGDPSESYFITRLLSKNNVTNTLSTVYDEIMGSKQTEVDVPSYVPERTSISSCEPESPRTNPDELGVCSSTELVQEKKEVSNRADEKEEIQINEVSSSSPIEAPPKLRSRKPKPQQENHPSMSDRTLRSHNSETLQKPRGRFTTHRGRRAPRPPDRNDAIAARTRASDRPSVVNEDRKPVEAKALVVIQKREPMVRITRSREIVEEGPRRSRPVTRNTVAPLECSKENFIVRGARTSIHSVGSERALRSRNTAPTVTRLKRPAPGGVSAAPPHKTARLTWPLAVRTRLRRRIHH